MDIKAHLLVCENTNKKNSDPHAIGILSVPWDQVDEHPKLQEVRDALSPEDRAACEKTGVLNLSVDYGFEEDYKNGVGLVMRDLKMDVGKLSEEKGSTVREWLEEQYGVSPTTDAELQAVLDNPDIQRHITTDMTVAGMGLETFQEALEAHASGEELPYPLLNEDMEKISASLRDRGKDADPVAYYNETAMKMREEWPSPANKNYGYEEPGEARVIFFTGFESSAEAIVKAGPYAALPAWPSAEGGMDAYDENGIACTEEGGKIPASEIKQDIDYVYYPHMAFSAELKGEDALAAIDRWSVVHEEPPLYDGYVHNCVGVAGEVALGDKYEPAVTKIAGIEHPEGTVPKITNAMLRQGVLLGATPPEGISVIGVSVDPAKLSSLDPQGINVALEQIAKAPERLKAEQKVLGTLGTDQFAKHAATLDEARQKHQGHSR